MEGPSLSCHSLLSVPVYLSTKIILPCPPKTNVELRIIAHFSQLFKLHNNSVALLLSSLFTQLPFSCNLSIHFTCAWLTCNFSLEIFKSHCFPLAPVRVRVAALRGNSPPSAVLGPKSAAKKAVFYQSGKEANKQKQKSFFLCAWTMESVIQPLYVIAFPQYNWEKLIVKS